MSFFTGPIYPPDPSGWLWPIQTYSKAIFHSESPSNGRILAVSAVPPSITVAFDGVGAADHYDVYRSESARDIGDRINVSPIAQPFASPWTFELVDDGVSSVSAPNAATQYFYRAVAVDALGNISLPSAAVAAVAYTGEYVRSDLRQNVMAYLKADPVLAALLDDDTADRIRGEHRYSEEFNDVPFVVVTDDEFIEDVKIQDPGKRHGVQPMNFEVYDQMASSQAVEDILNRIAAILRDEGGGRIAVASCNISVYFIMPRSGYKEFYDEAVRLHGKRIVVDFRVALKQS